MGKNGAKAMGGPMRAAQCAAKYVVNGTTSTAAS
jgi:hypothetical protein